jgi:hypothetical protein
MTEQIRARPARLAGRTTWHTASMGLREFLRQLRLASAGALLMVVLAWFLVSSRTLILTLFG